ncbi:hypothetical protein QBC46DRAFT_355245 [Diplogelasinospora grovesii]|uniref:DUF1793-domain-containing protein n=1 Tax=Diplogelasinospora grovesii TaxID=303347 RepID=A0AAN6N6C5_9PEZI|nr:hypothetical protein QBC46DRAFT_355245 [Diplogelasinospora grovesii]
MLLTLTHIFTGLTLACFVSARRRSTHLTDAPGQTLPVYSPVRPPAIPLAVRSPYTSAWSTTAGDGTLNSANVRFWNGSPLEWEGIVTVDGVSYEYLGAGSQSLPTMPNLVSATAQSVSYDSQYSNFTFAAGPVKITASFFSAVTPKDVCRSSIPLSYLATTAESTDGQSHNVQFYSDINAAWISKESNKTVLWQLYQDAQAVNGSGDLTSANTLHSWIIQLQSPIMFAEDSDFPQWGNFSYTTSPLGSGNLSFQSGSGVDVRYNYVQKGSLNSVVHPAYRGWPFQETVFAYSHNFGNVSSASVRYTIGSIQTPIIRYLYHGGVAALQPWWAKCYGDMFAMINFHWNDFEAVVALGNEFESQLKCDIDAYYQDNDVESSGSNHATRQSPPYANVSAADTMYGTDQYGQKYLFNSDTAYGYLVPPKNLTGLAVPDVSEAQAYYSIVALSARQVMHPYVYAVPPSGSCSSSGYADPLMFQKEISSDGNVNTVDVLYPATPFFLWANPEMLRYTLQPLFENQEGGFYPNGYSMHDLGTNFPNATGHVEGNDEYMPVEESANFIIMSYAYYKFSGNAAWLASHYPLLKQFAAYLTEFSLIPAAQLSTDDFAGQLVNQTNLAIKGIVGLQAMAAAARVVSTTSTASGNDATTFASTAADYYAQWEDLAVDRSATHTLLAYQWRSSWGLLYNIYPDKLLNLNIVTPKVYEMQSDFYPTVSQIFGVPLDNRHHYTKSDWMMWTAATCSAPTRRLFVNALAYWLNSTSTDGPFTDLYETVDTGSYPLVPDKITFQARPVVGGHYAMLALYRAGMNDDENSTMTGNHTSG